MGKCFPAVVLQFGKSFSKKRISTYMSNFHMHFSIILLSLCPAKTTNRLTKCPPPSLGPPDRRRNRGASRDPDRRAAHVPLRSFAQVKSLSRVVVVGCGGGGAKNDLLGRRIAELCSAGRSELRCSDRSRGGGRSHDRMLPPPPLSVGSAAGQQKGIADLVCVQLNGF